MNEIDKIKMQMEDITRQLDELAEEDMYSYAWDVLDSELELLHLRYTTLLDEQNGAA